MTELQIGLFGLGTIAVVGVLAYNKWQEHRHRKLAEQLLNIQHADILLDESNVGKSIPVDAERDPEVEPAAEVHVPPSAVPPPVIAEIHARPAPSGERVEPVLRMDADYQEHHEPRLARRETSVEPSDPMETAGAPVPDPDAVSVPVADRLHDEAMDNRDIPEPYHLLSPAVDYVVSFEAVEPAPAFQILESQRDVLARIRKPVHWIGYNELSREWEPIIDDGASEYRRLRVGLQLVDRQGPLSDGDLSVFHMAMHDLSDQLMAITDVPHRQAALDGAAKLDEFCASVDIQIGINVVSQGLVFPGTKLRALAEAAGMVIDGDGHFVRYDDDGSVLYVLLNQETSGFSAESMRTMSTHGVTFLLDVPRVAHGERVFNQMVELAKRFAEVLRGALVDDNRRPLSEGALEPIRRQVGQYQSMMAAHGLPAGGPLTRRLFS